MDHRLRMSRSLASGGIRSGGGGIIVALKSCIYKNGVYWRMENLEIYLYDGLGRVF
jgi:hypothetical protein